MKIKSFIAILTLFFVSCIYVSKYNDHSDFAKEKPVLNRVIRDLSFFPINGLRFRLSELKDYKAIVIVMRERDCPISEKYAPRLLKLEEKHSSKGVKFIYNYVGQVKRDESARKDLERYGFKGSYVIDTKQTVINALSAKTTGDVFVLTPERRIVYRGPVDDQYHLLKSALKPKNNYLDSMLSAIVENKSYTPKELPAPGCIISRYTFKKKVFWNDVAPIIKNKCTICHNSSGSAPIEYMSYEDVVGRLAMFRHVIEHDLMPPWGLDPNTGPWENDISLTVKEKAMLLKWVDNQAPKKANKRKLKTLENKSEKFSKSSIKKDRCSHKYLTSPSPNFIPDYTVNLPEKVVIPAEGYFKYKTWFIPTDFKEDKWIKEIQFNMQSQAIHHARIYIIDPLYRGENNHAKIFQNSLNSFGSLGGFYYEFCGDSIGRKIPVGAGLALSVHYESIGRKVIDDYTNIQFKFHKRKPEYRHVNKIVDDSKNIRIPPFEMNYQVKKRLRINSDIEIMGFATHMHLRGKAGEIFIIDPKGNKRRVFGIAPFIKNFERRYYFLNPLKVEKNSILECVFSYDNSVNNPINPDPSKYVRFGKFLTDEMALCGFGLRVPADREIKNYFKEL